MWLSRFALNTACANDTQNRRNQPENELQYVIEVAR